MIWRLQNPILCLYDVHEAFSKRKKKNFAQFSKHIFKRSGYCWHHEKTVQVTHRLCPQIQWCLLAYDHHYNWKWNLAIRFNQLEYKRVLKLISRLLYKLRWRSHTTWSLDSLWLQNDWLLLKISLRLYVRLWYLSSDSVWQHLNKSVPFFCSGHTKAHKTATAICPVSYTRQLWNSVSGMQTVKYAYLKKIIGATNFSKNQIYRSSNSKTGFKAFENSDKSETIKHAMTLERISRSEKY